MKENQIWNWIFYSIPSWFFCAVSPRHHIKSMILQLNSFSDDVKCSTGSRISVPVQHERQFTQGEHVTRVVRAWPQQFQYTRQGSLSGPFRDEAPQTGGIKVWASSRKIRSNNNTCTSQQSATTAHGTLYILDRAGCTRRRPWPSVAQPCHLALPAMHWTEANGLQKKKNNQKIQSTLSKLVSIRFEKASWCGTPRRSNGSLRFGKKCHVFRNEKSDTFCF